MQLAERCDVLLESFRPGVMKRLGLGYQPVRARAPHIVYCSIAAFGQSGARRDDPAHDLSVQALAGVVSLNEDQHRQPVMPHMPVADLTGSLMAFSGILMALLRRASTGEGDYLDISMHDAVLSWLVNVTGPVFAEGRAPVPKHERSFGGAAFFRIYRTRDGRHVTLGGSEIKFARNLLTDLGRPDLIPLCELPPGPGRTINESDISLFAGLTADYNPLHVDDVFASQTDYGGRIAHGPMLVGMTFGLLSRLDVIDGTAMALRGLEWAFNAPIRANDTVHVRAEVTEVRAASRHPDRGSVSFRFEIVNQDGVVVQIGSATVILKCALDAATDA